MYKPDKKAIDVTKLLLVIIILVITYIIFKGVDMLIMGERDFYFSLDLVLFQFLVIIPTEIFFCVVYRYIIKKYTHDEIDPNFSSLLIGFVVLVMIFLPILRFFYYPNFDLFNLLFLSVGFSFGIISILIYKKCFPVGTTVTRRIIPHLFNP